ncbi:MAG: hypothetical protein IPP40_16040 [bacterium]|nr:hypothetical protein [bacterium]
MKFGEPTQKVSSSGISRVKSPLRTQATKPITSRVEMRGDAYPGSDAEAANNALDSVLARLRDVPEYTERFAVAFPQENDEWLHGQREHVIDSSTYGRAMASCERELVTRNRAMTVTSQEMTTRSPQSGATSLELFFSKSHAPDTIGRCSATSSLL